MIAAAVFLAATFFVLAWTVVSIGTLHASASKLYLLDVARDAADPLSARDYLIRNAQVTR